MEVDRDPTDIGARVVALLDEFTDPETQERAERLTAEVMDFYGAALSRLVSGLADAGADGDRLLRECARDPLVASVLVLHDLHPVDVESRVVAALDSVRPYLGSHAGGVDVVGVQPDGEGGVVVTLHLSGSCDGCPSSLITVKTAIEKAILDAAPEVSCVVVENLEPAAEPTLLQIQPCPTEALAVGGAR